MSLGRLERLRFCARQFGTSSSLYSRGRARYPKPIPDKKTYEEDELTPQNFSEGKDVFAKPKREFDMEKFTQAVRRGDMSDSRKSVIESADKNELSSPSSRKPAPSRKVDTFGFDDEEEEDFEKSTMENTPQLRAKNKPSSDYDTPVIRRPVGRINGEEAEDSVKSFSGPAAERKDFQKKKREPTKTGSVKQIQPENGRGRYPFLEDKDPTFKNAINNVKNRKERLKHRRILLEGHRLIAEAVNNGVKIDSVFFSNPEVLTLVNERELHMMKASIYHVSPKQMALWSDMTSPPGIMAVAHMPNPSVMDMRNQMPLTIVLDNIRDPLNMGAIVRVVAGAACSQIIAMKGCVDPWDGKVLRTSMGAHFHVPIHYNMEWEMLNNYIDNPATVYLADNLEDRQPGFQLDKEGKQSPRLFPKKREASLQTIPYHHADFTEGSVVLIIGGETHGVSSVAYSVTKERRGKKIVIPLGNYVESLNAASAVAILAFEMRRQRLLLNDDIPEESDESDPQSAPGFLL